MVMAPLGEDDQVVTPRDQPAVDNPIVGLSGGVAQFGSTPVQTMLPTASQGPSPMKADGTAAKRGSFLAPIPPAVPEDGGEKGEGAGTDEVDAIGPIDESKLRLLYLLHLYTNRQTCEERGLGGDYQRWLRLLPLFVLMYEGVVRGCFEYDYAPQSMYVRGKRMYINTSQEGRDDVDDLRELKLVYGLKVTSKKYVTSVVLRISNLGSRYLDRFLDRNSKQAVEDLVYAPGTRLRRYVKYKGPEVGAPDRASGSNGGSEDGSDEGAGGETSDGADGSLEAEVNFDASFARKGSKNSFGSDIGGSDDVDSGGEDDEDDGEGTFWMYTEDGSYEEKSGVTEIEQVSYVSSPYLPQPLRRWGRETLSNTDRLNDLAKAASSIKDAELDEAITLDEVHMLVTEWVPMGGNQIVALNDKLGSSERVQGGFFTAKLDTAPELTDFTGGSEGLTAVNILDFDEAGYVNFEAEVYFPSDEGVVQIENFGVHFGEDGLVAYGLRVDGVMDRVRINLSLDLLSRLMVDVNQDTSAVVANLFSSHQRALLDLTFMGDVENRDKFYVLLTNGITPKMVADKYMDKETYENELKQVLGDTYSAHDLDDNEVLVIGKTGILVSCSAGHSLRHEPMVVAYASLQSRNVFTRSVFNRCFVLTDTLKVVHDLIEKHDHDPANIDRVRSLLSTCTEECIMLGEIQTFLLESMSDFEVPKALEDDAASLKLLECLRIEKLLNRMRARAIDIEKTITGASNDLTALREQADVINRQKKLSTSRGLDESTKNLEDLFRAGMRQGAVLEIMQVVLAGSLAFDVVDRTTGFYLGISQSITWANDWLTPYIVDTPFIWLAINLFTWVLFGGFLIWFMRYLAYMGTSVMSLRAVHNKKIVMANMRRYLGDRSIEVQDTDNDPNVFIKKYSWDEAPHAKWEGLPPTIEMTFDERYSFLLHVYIQVNKRKSKLSVEAAHELIFEDLKTYDCFKDKVTTAEITAPSVTA